MLPKSLSLFLGLFPLIAFGQSDVVKLVNELIQEEQYEKALTMADSLLGIPDLSEDYHYLYSRKGDAHYYLADIKSSLKNYLLAIEETPIKRFENKKALQEASSNVGFCYSDLGIHDKALLYYQASFDLAVELNDSSEVAVGFYNMSNAHLKQGKIEEGISLLEKAYEIDKHRKDTAALGFDLNALGYAALEMGNADDAIKYFKESILLLHKSSGNYNSLGTRYNNLSKAFLQMQMWDSALYFNQRSIEVHERFNDEINIAERWINRARILNQMNEPGQAIGWGDRAKQKISMLEKSDLLINANQVLTESNEKLGRFVNALALVESNLKLAEQLQSVKLLHTGYQKYAILLDKLGRTNEAYQALKTAGELADSLNSIDAQRAASELAVKYEVDKIESEKEILKLQNTVANAQLEREQTTNFWLVIVIAVVVLAGSTITFTFISRSRIKEQLMQAEINELRLQIKQLIDYKPEDSNLSLDQLNKVLNEPLSDREFEVLQIAMTDKNNGEIAEKIFVSTNTVKYHLKNIYQKLGVSNRKEALKFAFQATSG